MKNILSLFEAYGIELEYMIVDRETLAIRPISDRLLMKASGADSNALENPNVQTQVRGDFENGRISWSNELVMHVIELKTTAPDRNLTTLGCDFQNNIHLINSLLKSESAMLLPSGMHPLMDPEKEKKLWPHDNNEIYSAYDRIFDCKGHGWSNLQSMHINLPFANDDEFRILHTAIRFLLPMLPSLTASSPITDGKISNALDSRLIAYQQNQKRIPSIAGQVIPEPVISQADYEKRIFRKIFEDIRPHDTDSLLQEEWLNSRGAIARFSRNAIEIRVLDTQECPQMDLAIAEFIILILKDLTRETNVPFNDQFKQETSALKMIFDECAHAAENAVIRNKEYLKAWSINKSEVTAKQFWMTQFERPEIFKNLSDSGTKMINTLIHSGSLSTRILRGLNSRANRDSIRETYRELADCLNTGEPFQPQV